MFSSKKHSKKHPKKHSNKGKKAASASSFSSHGLINTPALEVLYRRAHVDNLVKGIHDPKEFETVELLENIFNKVIFRNQDYVYVNSQQPPGMESRKACDIVIKYATGQTFIPRILCFVECKRTKNTEYSLKLVENQAIMYCQEYLEKNTDVEFIYACTAAGAHLRLWSYSRGDKAMRGFWGSFSGNGYWEEYKDVGIDADGEAIWSHFNQMLAVTPDGHAVPGYMSLYAAPEEEEDDDDEKDEDFEDDEEEEEENEADVDMEEEEEGEREDEYVIKGQASSQASASGPRDWVWDEKRKRYRYYDGVAWIWQ